MFKSRTRLERLAAAHREKISTSNEVNGENE